MAKKRNTKKVETKKERVVKDPDVNSEDYMYDEIDKFHRAKDKIMLDAEDEELDFEPETDEEEVLGISGESESDDSAENENEEESTDDDNDDNEEVDEKDLINDKAWGKSKKAYYDADVQDDDVYASDEEANQAALEEEKEALSIQKRMAEQLHEQDFYQLDENEQEESDDEKAEKTDTKVVTDLSKLSKRERLEILSKQSPELLPLIEDYKDRLSELKDKYHPLLLMLKKGLIPSKQGQLFVETKHQLLASYCVNITFYLALKASKESTKGHPVFDTLVTQRELLLQMEPIEEKISAQIEVLLSQFQSGEWKTMNPVNNNGEEKKSTKQKGAKDAVSPTKKKKKPQPVEDKESGSEEEIDPLQYYKMYEEKRKAEKNPQVEEEEVPREITEEMDEETKRRITYEMSKNKGLIRNRRKELKNPRVKHKMKFKKAKIKHKGQVREIRNEMNRYDGEKTGIKSSLSRSTKIA